MNSLNDSIKNNAITSNELLKQRQELLDQRDSFQTEIKALQPISKYEQELVLLINEVYKAEITYKNLPDEKNYHLYQERSRHQSTQTKKDSYFSFYFQ